MGSDDAVRWRRALNVAVSVECKSVAMTSDVDGERTTREKEEKVESKILLSLSVSPSVCICVRE